MPEALLHTMMAHHPKQWAPFLLAILAFALYLLIRKEVSVDRTIEKCNRMLFINLGNSTNIDPKLLVFRSGHVQHQIEQPSQNSE